MLKRYFHSNITFLENPFSFSVALKIITGAKK